MSPRRGWREQIEPGIYRAHRLACESSRDEKTGRRCGCPYQVKVPGLAPGTTRMVKVEGSIKEARAERRRLMAEGRPEPEPEPAWVGTLDEFTASYFQAKAPVLAASTIRGRNEAYRHKVAPALGTLDVTEISRKHVEVWLADLTQKDTPHAVGKAVSALRAILNVAVEWGVITTNPAARLRLPKPADEDHLAPERVLDREQLNALFASAANDSRVETMFRAAGEAGLRRGEIMGLRWTDLDLPRRRLTVARAVWQQAGVDGTPPTRIIKAPKSGKTRTVAISQTFATRLADWYARSVVELGNDATGYVWPGKSGGLMGSSTVAQLLLRRLDELDMVENTKATRPEKEHPRGLVTLHGLRHTAASVMLGAGVPLIVVSRQLGHANPNITAKVYAHLVNRDEQLDAAAAVFDVQASSCEDDVLDVAPRAA